MRVVRAFLILCVCCPLGASAEPKIRVGIWPGDLMPKSVVVKGQLTVDGNGTRWQTSELRCSCAKNSIAVAGRGIFRPVQVNSRNTMTICNGSREFRAQGSILLRPVDGRIACIFILPVEHYTAKVLASEMPSNWHPQALAAQAVVARSFGLASRNRHAREGFDVCSLTHCQLVSPLPAPASTAHAAKVTAGQVLGIGGRIIAPPFNSTCGGATADGGKAGMAGWCISVSDNGACRKSPHYRWDTVLSFSDVASIFGCGLNSSGQVDLGIEEKDKSGYISKIVGEGETKKTMDGGAFLMACGRALGWARVKSCRFTISRNTRGYSLSGRGLGHGVGMCQWGARSLAEKGKSWEQILRTYYPKANLIRG